MGIVQAFEGNLINVSICIFVGMLFDFADGLAARLLKAYSEIGKELDSLADLVSFGVLPSVLIFQYLKPQSMAWAYLAFLIAVFSALRLAKFNTDTRQSEEFIGLPTPANALFFASFPLIIFQFPASKIYLTNFYGLIVLIFLSSFLMIAEIKLFSLKFKDFSWANNQLRFTFLILSLILLIIFQSLAIPLILLMYIIFSIFHYKN